MNKRCTFWLWAREQPPDGQMCGKPAVMSGEAIAFCDDHTDRLLRTLTPETLTAAGVTGVAGMMTRLGLTSIA